MKFQVKFYDIIDYNKCPSSEKSDEKHLLRKSNFHHSEPNHEEGTVDHRTQLGEDLLHLLTKGSSNDVKIILDDGEIYANKDILAIRSDYFSTMFSNTAFIEGKSGEVTVKDCTKKQGHDGDAQIRFHRNLETGRLQV